MVYLQAATAKFSVNEWVDGTAIYYWVTHTSHGMPNWLYPVLYPLVKNSLFVTAVTWGALLFELVLFACVIIDRKRDRRKAKVIYLIAVLFHFSIVVVHGLFSFFFVMWAALTLYLFPLDYDLKKRFYDLLSLLKKRLPASNG